MKTYVTLARVSSRNQLSFDRQEKACREYAERQAGSIIEVVLIAEDSSDGILKLIDSIKDHAQPIEAVLVYGLDRLSRNQTDKVLLAEHGIRIIPVSGTGEEQPK